ncbi:MAG: DnaJ domain-containing protein [Monoraphidium minutum]|nr:MAG: DnaJ domain-containing protein [Monoraphidium minutum]
MSCPYTALGLRRGAGADEVKRAYKALVVEHHPDKHATAPEVQQAAAVARFKTIQEAYQLLSDDRTRSAYEASRAAGRPTYGYASGADTDWSTRRCTWASRCCSSAAPSRSTRRTT